MNFKKQEDKKRRPSSSHPLICVSHPSDPKSEDSSSVLALKLLSVRTGLLFSCVANTLKCFP